MFCKFCGYKIDDMTVFCSNCGNKLSDKSFSNSEMRETLSLNKITSSSDAFNKNKSKIEVIAAKEIMINLKLALLSLCIAIFSYFVFYQINEPTQYTTDNLQYSQSKYDTDIPMGANHTEINDIVYNRFMEDIKSKSILSFTIALIILIIGRYIIKGFSWANESSKT